jgi:hypothetical protein
MRKQVRTLFDVGAIERTRSGGGARLVCRNLDAVRAWIATHYPSGLEGTQDPELPPRARAIANYADAKRADAADRSAILVRAFDVAKLHAGDDVLDAAELTGRFGMCALARPDGRRWRFTGRLAVIENMEVFLHAERVIPELDAAVWAVGGVASERVLAWLGELAGSGTEVVHAGDFDPVGLSHFLKVREACQGSATFFCPPDLEARVRRWGKARLLADSAPLFDRLRRERDQTIVRVIDILERVTKGLEHEALLLQL